MYKIKVFSIGKTKEPWLIQGLEEYTKRLKPLASITWILAKNEDLLNSYLKKENSFICLDEKGICSSSSDFSRLIQKELEQGGTSLSFVIGGDTGISENLKKNASCILSLSSLTFTHQMTRLILLEQLYRAFEIQKGSPYHK